MRNTLPTLTVLLPTRNRKEGFRRVLESLLLEKAQHYPHLEIVVIDGGSSDGTMEVIQEYAEDIVWHTQQSKGLYAALNEGLALATGDWVRMASDDDEFVTGALDPLVEMMITHPDALGVGGTCRYEQRLADGVSRSFNFGRQSGEFTYDNAGRMPNHILFVHESMFFRRSAVQEVGGWDERFVVSGDVDLVFRMLHRLRGRFIVVEKKVMHAVRTDASISIRHPVRGACEMFYLLARSHQWRLLGKACLHKVRGWFG